CDARGVGHEDVAFGVDRDAAPVQEPVAEREGDRALQRGQGVAAVIAVCAEQLAALAAVPGREAPHVLCAQIPRVYRVSGIDRKGLRGRRTLAGRGALLRDGTLLDG